MVPQTVGKKLYTPEVIIRAFEYFATSHCLYNKLRQDFQLPSIRTLTCITSKVSNLDESSFVKTIVAGLPDNQKLCILLQDEVYVKKAMLYHGGQLFGKAANHPSSLAQTVLGVMWVFLNGGPRFLSKLIPLSKLDSNFLHQQIQTLSHCRH